ncbi:hypothetical protein LJR153_005966 [Paenibacillus sp. LjRoot153]|uniref:hypothetical protein n=1 Tax=Paenibacillus sp. LjRoot153 TaxID=3342270 RepID=UPI003ECE2595
MKKKSTVYIVSTLAFVLTSAVMKSMNSKPYFIAGILPILGAIWLINYIIKGRLKPNGSKIGAFGLVFLWFGTGLWFFIIQFNLLENYQITYLIAVQLISFIWIAPTIIYRKIKIKK